MSSKTTLCSLLLLLGLHVASPFDFGASCCFQAICISSPSSPRLTKSSLWATLEEGPPTKSDLDLYLSSIDNAVYGAKFVEKLRDLRSYQLEHGHCYVPKRFVANPSLGNWVNKQRQLYRRHLEGEPTALTPARIEVLDRIGFAWTGRVQKSSTGATRERHDRRWMERYEELRRHRQRHGTCRLGKEHDADSPGLRSWVATQRKGYRRAARGAEGALSQKRVDMLRAIGFEVTSKYEELWSNRVRELKEYKSRYGDTLVPISYVENQSLAQWVSVQRRNYKSLKNGKKPYGLSRERVRELNNLGFVWNYREHEMEKNWSTKSSLGAEV